MRAAASESSDQSHGNSEASDSDDNRVDSAGLDSSWQRRDYFSFLANLPLEELSVIVPKDDTGTFTSIGSMPHADGKCKPCVNHALAIRATKVPMDESLVALGCRIGVYCRYCHFPHILNRAQRRGRPSKQQRNTYRELRHQTIARIRSDPCSFSFDSLELPDWIFANVTLLYKFKSAMEAEHARARVSQRSEDERPHAHFAAVEADCESACAAQRNEIGRQQANFTDDEEKCAAAGTAHRKEIGRPQANFTDEVEDASLWVSL